MRVALQFVLFVALIPTASWQSLKAQAPRIRTDREVKKDLALPDGEEMFQFVIFGDRTGGSAAGMKVLAQAVEDTNLLDPDLVVTVGDLVNGYNQTDAWMAQMREYRAVMEKLAMPWFPVAGNHDIFWRRDRRNPEPKPAKEHEESFEKHFGPLWYWFEHKRVGFLVLFSDEGHPDGRARDFTDPDQQRLSTRQMEWMTSALAEMKDLRHVFVFLHHPYWWDERYPANNWDEVHALLAHHGNVRAVFAGHIHRMRYDGARDGIEYYALAVTGGSIDESTPYERFGALHHYNVVTVRPDRYSVAAVPVDGVFDPKQFNDERYKEADKARFLMLEYASPPLEVRADGSVTSICVATVTNPLPLPLDATVVWHADASWLVSPDHRHGIVAPGETAEFSFAVVREAGRSLEGFVAPALELRFDVLTPELRLVMPARGRRMETALALGDDAPSPDPNAYLVFDGKTTSAEIRRAALEGATGSFTAEAWVRPAGSAGGGIVSNLAIGGWSLDVARSPQFRVQTDPPTTHYQTATRLTPPIAAAAKDALPADEWSHLAGVFDGRRIHLYVNGTRVASADAPGARPSSDKSLLIGAIADSRFHLYNESIPVSRWSGAIDEVRISAGARYTTDFVPERRLAADATTLLSMDAGRLMGAFIPVHGAKVTHAEARGELVLETSEPSS